MKDTIDSRAVKIAARSCRPTACARHDSIAKCHRVYVEEITCERCIRSWLLSKAKKELEKEGKQDTIPG